MPFFFYIFFKIIFNIRGYAPIQNVKIPKSQLKFDTNH